MSIIGKVIISTMEVNRSTFYWFCKSGLVLTYFVIILYMWIEQYEKEQLMQYK